MIKNISNFFAPIYPKLIANVFKKKNVKRLKSIY